jgi:hypothetical protein
VAVPPPRATACSRAHRAATHHGRSGRRPDLAGRAAGQARPPRPAPRPGRRRPPPTSHRPTRLGAASPASRPPGPSIEPSTPGSPRGLHRFWWSGSPDQLDLSPHATAGAWEETDASGQTGQTPDGRTPHGWTADGWTPDGWTADGRAPDLWTTTPGDRTPDAGRPDPGPPTPEGWTPPAAHSGDRGRGVAAGRGDHGADARPLATGWTLLGAAAVWASNLQDRSTTRTPRHPRWDGRAWPPPRPSVAGGMPPSSWRLGALLSSDDYGSSVEREALGQVLWRAPRPRWCLLGACLEVSKLNYRQGSIRDE